jgi:hypothetical protein
MAVMRFDPFRDFDRFTEQFFGGTRGLRGVPMEAYRRGDHFFIHLDLPGVRPDDVNLTLERNVVAVRAVASFPPTTQPSRRSTSSPTGDPRSSGSPSSAGTSTRVGGRVWASQYDVMVDDQVADEAALILHRTRASRTVNRGRPGMRRPAVRPTAR